MNIDILQPFQTPISKKRLHAYFNYLKVSSLVGGGIGFLVGLRLQNPLAGAMAGGIGGILLAQKAGYAKEYSEAQVNHFEKKERKRLIGYLMGSLPQAGQASPEVQQDLQKLQTKELYALAYFLQNTPKNLSEQTVLNVLLLTVKENYPSLFNALKK